MSPLLASTSTGAPETQSLSSMPDPTGRPDVLDHMKRLPERQYDRASEVEEEFGRLKQVAAARRGRASLPFQRSQATSQHQ